MINVLIIDDENHCIITLQHLLSDFKNVAVLATTQDSTKAKELVEQHKPDLVFLDIEMPILNGFDVLNQFGTIPFKVVFTTAYDQYAIKALKLRVIELSSIVKIEKDFSVRSLIGNLVTSKAAKQS